MLIRPAIITLAILISIPWQTQAALADPSGDVSCPPGVGKCKISARSPSAPGDSGLLPSSSSPAKADPAGKPVCTELQHGRTVPCSDPIAGVWDQETQCFSKLADPQPEKGTAIWQGHTDGAIYQITCPSGAAIGGTGWEWRPDPSAANAAPAAPAITPAQLAAQAVEQLPIEGPDIHMAPRRGSLGLVGLPVWMWTPATATTWGPASKTVSVPGLSVTATAKAIKIVWEMGDGRSVTCNGPGTPYDPRFGEAMSPDCGHKYSRSSARERYGMYVINATTTWDVSWEGGGQSGQLSVTRSSSSTARIGEMQVLVTS